MTFELSPQGFGSRSLVPAVGGFALVAALGAAQQASPVPLAIGLMIAVLVIAALCFRAWRRHLTASRLRLTIENGHVALCERLSGAPLGACALTPESVHFEKWSPPARWGSAHLDSPAVRIDGPWPFELSIGALTIWPHTSGPQRGLPRYLIDRYRWADLVAALAQERDPDSSDRSSRRS